MAITQETYGELYEASVRGSVPTLNVLLQRDPLSLDRISLTSFTETPLHIASLLGHLDFTRALLHFKPELATELDSHGRSALHLASSKGHAEVVDALLSTNVDACLIADQHGMIPLHLAAMRGQVEVIQQLITACPASVKMKLPGGQTNLHLCVKYNRLEALKLLVTSAKDDVHFLNSVDNDGNNIVHFAARMKQLETVKYLAEIPEFGVEADTLVAILGDDHLISDHDQRDIQIKQDPKSSDVVKVADDKWIKKQMGDLMIVATVIASMTFQAAMNPPGGVWQADQAANVGGCPAGKYCKAGTSVLAYTNTSKFQDFVYYNNVSFTLAMTIIIILVGGITFNKRFAVWILLVFVIVTATFLGLSFITSLNMVGSPEDSKIEVKYMHDQGFWKYYPYAAMVFMAFIALCLLLKTMFFAAMRRFLGRFQRQPKVTEIKSPAGAV